MARLCGDANNRYAPMGTRSPSGIYARFADAYGYDMMAWEGFPTISSVVQLRMVTWLAQNVGHSSAAADEYRKRMRTLRDGFTENWSGF